MKSVTGFVLGLIGGIGNVLLALFFGIFSLLFYFGKSGLESLGSSEKVISFAGNLWVWFLILFLWFLFFGFFGFYFSSKMNRPYETKRGGVWCLIIGILSINIFIAIGGIFGIMASGRQRTGVPIASSSNFPRNVSQAIGTVSRNLQNV